MGNKTKPFVVTANVYALIKRADKLVCGGCGVELQIGDSAISNASGKKRYHYRCGKTLKIV